MTPVKPRTAGSAFAATARAYATLAARHGQAVGGVEIAAAVARVRVGTAYAWTDPDKGDGVPFAIAAELTERFGLTEFAEHLAACAGGTFMPAPPAGAGEWSALTAEAAERFGATLAEIVRAIADLKVTRREAGPILADIDSLIVVLMRLRALAVAAQDAGVAAGVEGTP